jgi:mono/diheme cytochrome c family protein
MAASGKQTTSNARAACPPQAGVTRSVSLGFCPLASSRFLLRWIVAALLLLAQQSASARTPVDFDREVRPLLAKNCFICHGPDEKHREAGLRLDVREAAIKPLDDGKTAIRPGRPEASELIRRITSTDQDERMPPGRANRTLDKEQIDLLTRWVKEGAAYRQHWSFEPLQRPPLPRVAVAQRRGPTGEVRNPIDLFIGEKLAEAGLSCSPPADRYALIRRLSLDLRGLPPSRAEAAEFVADKNPDAYERLLERMLADPAFGERWARPWLDLARYADTKGYSGDPPRTIWLYRDWVIDAFNADMPFDQFTIEQLAGDLLPGARTDQLIATAFNRNTTTNTSPGDSDEEYRVKAVLDRVDTTMDAWMGLTFACAKCHSHKFDPITQTDYYRIMAIFNQTEDNDRADEAPTIDVRSAAAGQGVFSSVPIMRERPPKNRRKSYVLKQGDYLFHGGEVSPGVPALFGPLRRGVAADRLSLARWLVDRRNPLTARVAVNRIWAQLFGRGLVETEEDFGTQGSPPTHQNLLDWLAVEYIDRGWDTKSLIRLIAKSATYRQSSRVTKEAIQKDRDDRLLGRAPRFRLEAELVRDQALALSGLLTHRMKGPSVFPPQPEPARRGAAKNPDPAWPTARGENRYRRGIYTFWRRSDPYPSMAALDAPNRDVCAIRRVRTNTPLQAYVTLNDPAYVEAAQALARRILREGGRSSSDRCRYALGLCLVRPPEPRQVDQLLALLASADEEYFRKDAKSAHVMAKAPYARASDAQDEAELAAWTVVANVLLNLDGVLTKG